MVMDDQSRPIIMPTSWADPEVSVPWGSRWRRALPLLVWLACLVAAVVLLHALGDGRLAAPALTDPGAWSAWAAGGDPLEVAMVTLRLLALGLAWHLTGVTSISIVARLLRAARLVRVADALSFGPVKVLVQQALGIGLATSVLATAVPGASATVVITPLSQASQPDATPVAQRGFVGPEVSLVAEDAEAPAPGRAVLAPVPAPARVAPVPAAPEPSEEPDAPTGPAVTPPAGATDADVAVGSSGPREVRVQPGDHFWAIAEADVARHLGRPGTDVEVVARWQAILEANAHRLPVPGNPDVLFPGQLVLLPPMAEVRS